MQSKSVCFLFLLISIAYTNVSAQFDPLTIYTSGSGTYSRSQDTQLSDDAEITVQNAVGSFSLGIFPMPKLLAGVGFSLIGNKEEGKNILSPSLPSYKDYSNKSTSRNITQFVRYYISKGLFCEANYMFGRQKITIREIETSLMPGDWSSTFEGSREVKIRGFSVGAGYSFFLNKSKNVALDAGIFYQSYKSISKYAALSVGLGVSGFIFKKDNND